MPKLATPVLFCAHCHAECNVYNITNGIANPLYFRRKGSLDFCGAKCSTAWESKHGTYKKSHPVAGESQ